MAHSARSIEDILKDILPTASDETNENALRELWGRKEFILMDASLPVLPKLICACMNPNPSVRRLAWPFLKVINSGDAAIVEKILQTEGLIKNLLAGVQNSAGGENFQELEILEGLVSKGDVVVKKRLLDCADLITTLLTCCTAFPGPGYQPYRCAIRKILRHLAAGPVAYVTEMVERRPNFLAFLVASLKEEGLSAPEKELTVQAVANLMECLITASTTIEKKSAILLVKILTKQPELLSAIMIHRDRIEQSVGSAGGNIRERTREDGLLNALFSCMLAWRRGAPDRLEIHQGAALRELIVFACTRVWARSLFNTLCKKQPETVEVCLEAFLSVAENSEVRWNTLSFLSNEIGVMGNAFVPVIQKQLATFLKQDAGLKPYILASVSLIRGMLHALIKSEPEAWAIELVRELGRDDPEICTKLLQKTLTWGNDDESDDEDEDEDENEAAVVWGSKTYFLMCKALYGLLFSQTRALLQTLPLLLNAVKAGMPDYVEQEITGLDWGNEEVRRSFLASGILTEVVNLLVDPALRYQEQAQRALSVIATGHPELMARIVFLISWRLYTRHDAVRTFFLALTRTMEPLLFRELVIRPILERLSSTEMIVKESGALALAEIGKSYPEMQASLYVWTYQALQTLLLDPDESVSRQALLTLWLVGDEGVKITQIDQLSEQCADADPLIRQRAEITKAKLYEVYPQAPGYESLWLAQCVALQEERGRQNVWAD